ncbi:MAG TPA: carbon starvation protein A [Verrucomicrobiales bacterium]|nr:carbon starvation protein A [Verrucomicrobiales bacterium]
MQTLAIALGALVFYLIAYHTYGKFLARKIFKLNPEARVPSVEMEDGNDYVPTRKGVIFGHHFTSIAGTGPIVGPALAVIWGWLPALLWVLFGSILIGAVHDFGALVVSIRNRGQTVGDIAGRVLSNRTRLLFLSVLFLSLTIVLAIFGLVIASVWDLYPQSISPCLIQIPLAVLIGVYLHRRGVNILIPSIITLGLMYLTIFYGNVGVLGAFNELLGGEPGVIDGIPTIAWVAILLLYSYIASVLPVWTLLQPRDFINSLQLISALGLIVIGLVVAGLIGGAPITPGGDRQSLEIVAPAFRAAPEGAPWIFPFLFITIACGAISGFHCLVSSGTSSKQVKSESDAQFVGYGSMLTEGFLATLVILACVAGLGLGAKGADGILLGSDAYEARYDSWAAAGSLGAKVGAFVEGAANFLVALGLSAPFAIALMGVFVASFAATTLDTACRLQRYVVQELASTFVPGDTSGPSRHPLSILTNKHGATIFAIILTGALAALPPPEVTWTLNSAGKGGLILWPLFGATNQLLAGLAFLVITFWLWRRSLPVWFIIPPTIVMLILPGIAMTIKVYEFLQNSQFLLAVLGLATIALQLWIILEAKSAWPRARGEIEDLSGSTETLPDGGRSC